MSRGTRKGKAEGGKTGGKADYAEGATTASGRVSKGTSKGRAGGGRTGGAAGLGKSKPSGPKGHTFAPGWKGNRDDLAPFRRVAGETVITHFGGKGEEQTTLLPPVGGACNHAERHVVAEEDEENEEEEEEEEEEDDPVELDFFVTDKEILVREMRCLVCPGRAKGTLKVRDSEKRILEARTPPIRVVSYTTILRAKAKNALVKKRPP